MSNRAPSFTIVPPLPIPPPVAKPPAPSPKTPVSKEPAIAAKRAVLIGINYLNDKLNTLKGCINDVRAIRNMLVYRFQYRPENIRLLVDDESGDAMPTRANIMAELAKAVEVTRPGDSLYVAYSGHGSQVKARGSDERNNPETPNLDDVLVPCDFNSWPGEEGFILDDDLKEQVVNKIPKGAKLRVTIDACHSGTMFDLEYLWKGQDQFLDEYAPDAQSDDVLMISGCRDSQTSADSWNAQRGQSMGALTMMLIKALTNSASVPTTWRELVLVVRHLLLDAKYDQVPQLEVADKKLLDRPIDL